MVAKVVIITLCAIVATLNAQPVSVDQQDCPKICPDLYAPVCASDGTTFQEFVNPCQLQISNCLLQNAALRPSETTIMDWCRTEKIDSLDNLLLKLGNVELNETECSKACTKIYQPVCISNGQYRTLVSNECFMDNINCALGNQENFRVLQNDTC